MDVEAFIRGWTSREGGAERANYQMFLSELCDVLDVPRPEPAGAEPERNDYVFERAVRPRGGDPAAAPKRIDLYRKGAFILEAKQSRLPGKKKAIPGGGDPLAATADEPQALGRRGVERGWDAMMQNARKQAEAYVFLLDPDHPAPPFVITCDVGHCLELYADFTGTGRAYGQFPDRNGFRVYLEDLRDADVRERLRRVWMEPQGLDPARESARVTREIARRLAAVSRHLEAAHPPEAVAHFLMRCIFTMFAEDVDLLPKGSFTGLLQDCVADPDAFAPLLEELWAKMDEPLRDRRFFSAFRIHLRYFNGNLFKNAPAFPLGREEIGELLAASRAKWTEVDPAIFGTLLEQALDPRERRKLGAHYTPRAYVQRLVEATVMEPLRADWEAALTKAEAAKEDGDERRAARIVRAFHRQLCATRVLDPACGTGNFLYVSLELMKRLEGEVLETLAKLGEPESMGLDRETVDPHGFLGLELNPRAAAIAELVVWIGYLQQHYRTRTGHPAEPILRAFANINFGMRSGYDAVLTWDGYPAPTAAAKDGRRIDTYPNPRRPAWPEAEFIVGNPPFIAGQDLRDKFGSGYAQALWAAHPEMNDSADFVMYWWDRAAAVMSRTDSSLRRFGFVTTNSISQVFQRRTVARWLAAKRPISLVWAVDNHPWTKATPDAAAVRIAMTVAEKGAMEGRLLRVVQETGLETDQPAISIHWSNGKINSDLTIGADVTRMTKLLANEGLSHDGVKLHGKGFVISKEQAESLGLGQRPGLENYIRTYRNGRDMRRGAEKLAIDFFGLGEVEVRTRYPEAYQHLLERVRYDLGPDGQPKTNKKGRRTGREWNNRPSYCDNWWIFGEPRSELRPALAGISRFVGTVDTSPNRVFEFIDSNILVDDGVVIVASDAAEMLAILSSRTHVLFSLRAGGWLGVGDDPRWNKSLVFEPFPFPTLDAALKSKLRAAGEELDATRKRVLAGHPDLTLTGLYNVLEKVRSGATLAAADEDVKRRGLVLILKELHETIDRLTADAYGWPADLGDDAILERLVALNAERAREEAAGQVRWLRPDYQVPRFARGAAARTGELALGATVVAIDRGLPAFPADRDEQPLAVEAMLLSAGRPLDAAALARGFRRGGRRIEPRIAQILTTLARYGRVTAFEDGRFAARRAA